MFWNRSAERILGHKADQVIGRSCYEVLGGLSEDGLTPVCRQDCPAIRSAREGRVPLVVRVRVHTGAGRQHQVEVTPLLVPAAQAERTALLSLFYCATDETQATGAADAVQGMLSEPEFSAAPTGPTAIPARTEADPFTTREHDVLRLLARGPFTRAVADELTVTEHTVSNHVPEPPRETAGAL